MATDIESASFITYMNPFSKRSERKRNPVPFTIEEADRFPVKGFLLGCYMFTGLVGESNQCCLYNVAKPMMHILGRKG